MKLHTLARPALIVLLALVVGAALAYSSTLTLTQEGRSWCLDSPHWQLCNDWAREDHRYEVEKLRNDLAFEQEFAANRR